VFSTRHNNRADKKKQPYRFILALWGGATIQYVFRITSVGGEESDPTIKWNLVCVCVCVHVCVRAYVRACVSKPIGISSVRTT